MNYLTARQIAEKWGISLRRVQALLKDGRIPGAIKPSRDWLIPKDAEKPRDTRGDWNRKAK
jgi:excisionase family DNA binding protein